MFLSLNVLIEAGIVGAILRGENDSTEVEATEADFEPRIEDFSSMDKALKNIPNLVPKGFFEGASNLSLGDKA